MKYMKIGHSDVEASVITLGSWAIGGGKSWQESVDDESIACIRAALDNGINMIDTAPIYALGHSEELVGQAIKGYDRTKVNIVTKATFTWHEPNEGIYVYDMYDTHIYKNMSYDAIKKDCENSLKRMGVDYIDIYMMHNPSPDPEKYPAAESVRALMDLKKEGKIRGIGLSNVQAHHIEEYIGLGCELDLVQRKYSMIDRTIEADIIPLARKYGFSIHAYSPLERGLLTGAISKDTVVPKGDARDGLPWWSPEKMPIAIDFVDSLADIREKNNCSPVELAVAYNRAQGDFMNVIMGAHKPEEALADAKLADFDLPAEDLAEIKRRLAELDKQINA